MAALTYADDIMLDTSSYEELRHNREIAERYFQNVGLSLNPKKMHYFGWKVEAHCVKLSDYNIPGYPLVIPRSRHLIGMYP